MVNCHLVYSQLIYYPFHLKAQPRFSGLGLGLEFNNPFTKTSPNYPHKNNADNSIKIAFTNSERPKIIRTLFTNAHLKKN